MDDNSLTNSSRRIDTISVKKNEISEHTDQNLDSANNEVNQSSGNLIANNDQGITASPIINLSDDIVKNNTAENLNPETVQSQSPINPSTNNEFQNLNHSSSLPMQDDSQALTEQKYENGPSEPLLTSQDIPSPVSETNSVYSGPTYIAPTEMQQKKSKIGVIILSLCLIIVAVALLAIFVWPKVDIMSYFRINSNSNTTTSPSPTVSETSSPTVSPSETVSPEVNPSATTTPSASSSTTKKTTSTYSKTTTTATPTPTSSTSTSPSPSPSETVETPIPPPAPPSE